ncbi:hypothetical protein AX17_003782 [Amanita inopinata Kibby_2008]|nr:hypothetical protein AX17_003782 [Amanita inopinata Kibby_2008]
MTDTNHRHPPLNLTSDRLHDSLTRPNSLQPHARSSSTTSNTTVPENTSDLSHQTEPLLHPSPSVSDSVAYLELRQPVNRNARNHSRGWNHGFGPPAAAAGRRGRTSFWETIVRKRLRLLWVLKRALEAVIALWAIYTGIRYFVAYSKYTSSPGQVASLALAVSTSLSLVLLICATLLSVFKMSLIQSIPPRASLILRKTIRALSSCLILAPALSNVIFLCIWKNSGDTELTYRYRCYIDIDIVWSVSKDECVAPPWGIWLVLALVRLVITTVVLVSYHIFSFAYGRTRRISTSRRFQDLGLYETTDASSSPTTQPSMKEAGRDRNLQPQHRPSRSTLDSNVESTHSVLPYHLGPKGRLAHSNSFTSSEDDHSANTVRVPPGLNPNHHGPGPEENVENWGDALSEQFRTLISQINEEVEEVIDISRSSNEEDRQENNPYPPPHSSSPYGFNLPSIPPVIGYNEFGQPYPPEEPLPILNGFIRRMPTIESMGSREFGSVGSSMYTNKEPKIAGSARSTLTFERPPTRALSRTDNSSHSEPSSRPNSFGARAELMASLGGTSEVGELLDRIKREDLGGGGGGPSEKSQLDASRGASASRSTMSYYTANSGSTADS